MKRIMIFGIPGSGKSTLAVQLSKKLKLPLYHLDRYFFIENWVERDYQEFLQIQKDLVDQKAWIIDGNAIKSLEMRYAKADLVLYFRYNRLLCLWRVFKRLFSKDSEISDRADGCSETLRWSLIRYLWEFDKRVSPIIKDLKDRYPQTPFYEFHNSREWEKFARELSPAATERPL